MHLLIHFFSISADHSRLKLYFGNPGSESSNSTSSAFIALPAGVAPPARSMHSRFYNRGRFRRRRRSWGRRSELGQELGQELVLLSSLPQPPSLLQPSRLPPSSRCSRLLFCCSLIFLRLFLLQPPSSSAASRLRPSFLLQPPSSLLQPSRLRPSSLQPPFWDLPSELPASGARAWLR